MLGKAINWNLFPLVQAAAPEVIEAVQGAKEVQGSVAEGEDPTSQVNKGM